MKEPIEIINIRINLRAIQKKYADQNLIDYYNIFGRDKKQVLRFDKLAIDKNFKFLQL